MNSDMPTEDLKVEIDAYREQFGLPTQEQEEQTEETNEETEQEETEETEETPATESKGRTVKFNKEDRFVPEEEMDELIQKGLVLDKERQRKTEYEKALERAAKLAGFESHEEFMKNLDKLEQERQQKEKDEFEQLRKQLREEFEDAGLDPKRAEEYIENHPLMKQAQKAIQEAEQLRQEQQKIEQQQQSQKAWDALFEKYPDLPSQVDEEGNAPWLTEEMLSRINRGYDPIDAYELAHRETIFQMERKKAEQAALKQQRLNKRSQVDDQKGVGEIEPEVPQELATAFSLFNLPLKNARKYVKER